MSTPAVEALKIEFLAERLIHDEMRREEAAVFAARRAAIQEHSVIVDLVYKQGMRVEGYQKALKALGENE